MNILFLTQYFPPEMGAPQNRLHDLAVRLQKNGINVTVLTAMPNYPRMVIRNEYKGKFYCKEQVDNLLVYRSYIFIRRSHSLILRLINYFSFVLTSIVVGTIKVKKQDYILCESPPLFLGISALVLCKLKRAKLIFNVSDLWPESAEKLGLVTNHFLLSASTWLEEYLYKNAELITCQTQGILSNIANRFPGKRIYWLKNGVDVERFKNYNAGLNWRKTNLFSEKDFLVYYGGILGFAQGLEVILYAAEILKRKSSIKFIIVGDGPEKERLQGLKNKLSLNNVFFFDPVPKDLIPEVIFAVDVGIIPLKNLELFRGAIPSKIFEIQILKKPILLGVEGEADELFIKKGNGGLAFIPEDPHNLVRMILKLYESPSLVVKLGENGYNYVKKNFNRDQIAAELISLLGQ